MVESLTLKLLLGKTVLRGVVLLVLLGIVGGLLLLVLVLVLVLGLVLGLVLIGGVEPLLISSVISCRAASYAVHVKPVEHVRRRRLRSMGGLHGVRTAGAIETALAVGRPGRTTATWVATVSAHHVAAVVTTATRGAVRTIKIKTFRAVPCRVAVASPYSRAKSSSATV